MSNAEQRANMKRILAEVLAQGKMDLYYDLHNCLDDFAISNPDNKPDMYRLFMDIYEGRKSGSPSPPPPSRSSNPPPPPAFNQHKKNVYTFLF
jgi:hypothetical protein